MALLSMAKPKSPVEDKPRPASASVLLPGTYTRDGRKKETNRRLIGSVAALAASAASLAGPVFASSSTYAPTKGGAPAAAASAGAELAAVSRSGTDSARWRRGRRI